ncbi:MAG: serine/threonine-protein kinase [Acidobacteriota bacterium]|nr:serine/threonine-protein kinase [Acidobacteriota bacterium]
MSLIGAKVGNIRIEKRLGKGGMGAVYVGWDKVLKREVAVKAIRKDYSLNPEARMRFLREARILSRLDHPHICRIYEYLESEQDDLLILEMIHGKSLQKLDHGNMRFPEKLRLAEELISAVSAAHAAGVVHRDLKPDNVMVTDDGKVKVLDFGLSRVQDDQMLSRASMPGIRDTHPSVGQGHQSGETQMGSLMGTLGYMSPEAARGEVATAASDVYAVSLLLQEIFTGEPAFERGKPFGVRLRMAAEGKTQPLTGLDPDLTALLNRMKSVEPAARPSAEDARERIAWLRDRPRRVRRRRMVAALVGASLIFAGVMGYQARRIQAEAERANREAERANAEALTARRVSSFLEGLFDVVDPSKARGNSVTARELLDRGSERINRELADQPLTRARLITTMGNVYNSLGLYDKALALYKEALALRQANLDAEHLDVAESMFNLANMYEVLDKEDLAGPLARRALIIRRTALPPDHPDIADSLGCVSRIYWSQGNYEEAVKIAEESLAILDKYAQSKPLTLAETLNLVGTLYDETGRAREAEEMLLRAKAIWENDDPDHPKLIKCLNNLGAIYAGWGRYAEAEQLYVSALDLCERLLGRDHHNTAFLRNNLADVYASRGEHEKALVHFQRAREIWLATLGPDHGLIALVLDNIGSAYVDLGKDEQALANLEQSLAITEKTLGKEHGDLIYILVSLARAHLVFERPVKARAYMERGFALMDKGLSPDPIEIGDSIANLALIFLSNNYSDHAETAFERAVRLWEGSQVHMNEGMEKVITAYADMLEKQGRKADAELIRSRGRAMGENPEGKDRRQPGVL